MSENIIVPTSEMIQFFEKRVNNHIKLVQESIFHMIKAMPFMDGMILIERGKCHDITKFKEPERTPYIWINHAYNMKLQGISFKYPKGIEKQTIDITEYHVKHNRHHPEFHCDGPIGISHSDRDSSDFSIDASRMLDVDIAEMVADWIAMSQEKRTNTPREWFNKCSGVRWTFTNYQLEIIDKLLKTYENK